MATIERDLATRLRQARDRRILTQEELAAELGIPPRSLQDYEAGKATPRPLRRRRILAWLTEQERVVA